MRSEGSESEGYIIVSTPQKRGSAEGDSSSFMGRMSARLSTMSLSKMLSSKKLAAEQSPSDGIELEDREGYNNKYDSPESIVSTDPVAFTPIEDTKSEAFTSPPLSPRTPMKSDGNGFTPPPAARPSSLNLRRRSNPRVFTDEEQLVKAEIEARREGKWASMMESWTITSTFRRQTLKRRIRKGVPAKNRAEVWPKLVNVEEARIWFPSPQNAGVERLPPYIISNIEKDIPRTFPTDERFSDTDGAGQASLRNVLQWYAAFDSTVNYCQGMSFTAAVLLTRLPEEEAYYCFVTAMQKKGLRSLYMPGMVDLMRKTHVLTKLVEKHLPELYLHLEEEGIKVAMFSTDWLMTLFSRQFDEELACRTLEIFLFEGYKIVYRISLSLLKFLEAKIMRGSFENILGYIRELPAKVDTDKLLLDCFKWPVKRADLVAFEREYDESEAGIAASAAAEVRTKEEEARRECFSADASP
jgi:hypothetical protein